jgi:hypothetical protein
MMLSCFIQALEYEEEKIDSDADGDHPSAG